MISSGPIQPHDVDAADRDRLMMAEMESCPTSLATSALVEPVSTRVRAGGPLEPGNTSLGWWDKQKHVLRFFIPTLLASVILAACTEPPDGGDLVRGPSSFKTADAWIKTLNQHGLHGIHCQPSQETGRLSGPIQFRYVDTGSCRLDKHGRLTVWIVEDAERTLKRYFMNRRRPLFYLHLDNWFVVFPDSVPYKTVLRIRKLFGSKITEGFRYEQ
jgi:hypothetical protein